jgi:hypothetical protein
MQVTDVNEGMADDPHQQTMEQRQLDGCRQIVHVE